MSLKKQFHRFILYQFLFHSSQAELEHWRKRNIFLKLKRKMGRFMFYLQLQNHLSKNLQ